MIAVVAFSDIGAREIVKKLKKAELVSPYDDTNFTLYSGIILSGASKGISYDYKDYHESLIIALATTSKPILGICFGMQFLAVLYDAKIKDNKEKGWYVVSLDDNELFYDYSPRELVMMDHDYGITKPDEFNVIASTVKNPIAAIQHETLPIWGVIWHPERVVSKRGSVLFKNFERICGEVQ